MLLYRGVIFVLLMYYLCISVVLLSYDLCIILVWFVYYHCTIMVSVLLYCCIIVLLLLYYRCGIVVVLLYYRCTNVTLLMYNSGKMVVLLLYCRCIILAVSLCDWCDISTLLLVTYGCILLYFIFIVVCGGVSMYECVVVHLKTFHLSLVLNTFTPGRSRTPLSRNCLAVHPQSARPQQATPHAHRPWSWPATRSAPGAAETPPHLTGWSARVRSHCPAAYQTAQSRPRAPLCPR